MITKDDRTPEEKKTYKWGVVAKDKFMSGWGEARGGVSRCAWACAPDADINKLLRWVESRSEMRYVNVVDLSTYRPKNTVHYHIYKCEKDHPSQN